MSEVNNSTNTTNNTNQCQAQFYKFKLSPLTRVHASARLILWSRSNLYPRLTLRNEISPNDLVNNVFKKITNAGENLAEYLSARQADINQQSTLKTLHTVLERSPSKSYPYDLTATNTLNSCLTELPLVIVNSSIQEWDYSTLKLKKTSMEKDDINSFRHITNLAFFSFYGNLINELSNCTSKLQKDYQQLQPTETALLRVHNDILRAVDDRKEVILVLLELTLWITKFSLGGCVNNLDSLGKFCILRWFTSYLRNRCQQVIGNPKSRSMRLSYELPKYMICGHCYYPILCPS